MTATVNAVGAEPRNPGESQDQGRMEVDHPEPGAEGSGESDCRAPDVQVEIEQRWHQVETTPLREEKQVPISTTDASLTERLPPQELAALLDKEVGFYVHRPKLQYSTVCHYNEEPYYILMHVNDAAGADPEGAGQAAGAEQHAAGAARRCQGQRAQCQGGLRATGTTRQQ